jgi:hypothetical protein
MSRFVALALLAVFAATAFPWSAATYAQSFASASHRPLAGAPDTPASPEEAMSRRLREISDSRLAVELAKKLLENPKFREQLSKDLPEGKLKELAEKFRRGENPAGDPAFQDLLSRVRSNPPQELSKEHLELLGRQFPPPARMPVGSRPAGGGPGGNPPVPTEPPGGRASDPPPPGTQAPGTAPPPPPPPQPPKSALEKFQKDAYDWLQRHSGDFSDRAMDILSSLGGDEVVNIMKEGFRSVEQRMGGDDGLAGSISRALRDAGGSLAGIAEKIPDTSLPNWADLSGMFQEGMPSLPRVRRPSLPTAPFTSVQDTGPLALWIAVVVIVGFLLWRSTSKRAWSEETWRVGPWPVLPDAVATRRDLVLAFEHLALRYLGLAARSCHHLELADRLAAQKADPRQREAAAELAHLYEQARYTPDEELLTADNLSAARRDLCLLAGVAGA